MKNITVAQWILRVAVAGEFFGHGIFAIQGKKQWITWIGELIAVTPETAATLLLVVGIMDVLLGVLVLIKPIKPLLLWMAVWGFWTALVRPLVGEPVWDFIERWANWGAPLALFYLLKKK